MQFMMGIRKGTQAKVTWHREEEKCLTGLSFHANIFTFKELNKRQQNSQKDSSFLSGCVNLEELKSLLQMCSSICSLEKAVWEIAAGLRKGREDTLHALLVPLKAEPGTVWGQVCNSGREQRSTPQTQSGALQWSELPYALLPLPDVRGHPKASHHSSPSLRLPGHEPLWGLLCRVRALSQSYKPRQDPGEQWRQWDEGPIFSGQPGISAEFCCMDFWSSGELQMYGVQYCVFTCFSHLSIHLLTTEPAHYYVQRQY